MKRYETSYFFREGVRGIFLHGFMSFAAIGVIVACLLIMGSFSLLAYNLNALIGDIQNSSEIYVFVDETLSDAEARSVGTRINRLDNVDISTFVSRDEALVQFGERLDEEYSALIEGLEQDNPLRHRYVVRLIDTERMAETVAQLQNVPGVDQVNARLDITENILLVRGVVNTVSLALIVVLLAVSVFIISNTVKLATFDRREEIAIMRVVGATKRFIRWPFVIEGFLLGLTGAVAAFFLQWGLYLSLSRRVTEGLKNIALVQMAPFDEILPAVLLVFLLVGFLVGMGGSLLTIRRFMRV
ncbi:MAG: permease-like cell division protein FtsX [Oscillospiraceae bacterium]|jgi:cell division transport system permease protein|nr:permease-like cell division protein FtsX [Oscillospiraceae bacterium]